MPITLPSPRGGRWVVDDTVPAFTDPDPDAKLPNGHRLRNPVGTRRGRLVILEYRLVLETPWKCKSGSGYHPYCRCDCGRETMMNRGNFAKATKCWDCAIKSDYRFIVQDDRLRTLLLRKLLGAKQRCHNPKQDNYASYGGRGIRVCDEWRQDRGAFLRHAITLDGWDDPSLQLDRIDVDGHYEPGNVRFVSAKQNSRNRRKVNTMSQRIKSLEAELSMYRSQIF